MVHALARAVDTLRHRPSRRTSRIGSRLLLALGLAGTLSACAGPTAPTAPRMLSPRSDPHLDETPPAPPPADSTSFGNYQNPIG